MDLRFFCHDCGQRYRAPRDQAGSRYSCRRCGWPGRVPGRAGRAQGRAEAPTAAARRNLGANA